MESNLFNQIFRDQEGNVVLAQMPNPPLITCRSVERRKKSKKIEYYR